MNKYYIILFFSIIIIFASTDFVFAQSGTNNSVPVSLPNPLGSGPGDTDPNLLIGQVINVVLGLVGSLALVMFIYGGLVWMLAAGNNEKVQTGKNILMWATIGLVVIFSSYALVKFVFEGLGIT